MWMGCNINYLHMAFLWETFILVDKLRLFVCFPIINEYNEEADDGWL